MSFVFLDHTISRAVKYFFIDNSLNFSNDLILVSFHVVFIVFVDHINGVHSPTDPKGLSSKIFLK